MPFALLALLLTILEHAKYVSNRQLLETQLTENKMVKDVG